RSSKAQAGRSRNLRVLIALSLTELVARRHPTAASARLADRSTLGFDAGNKIGPRLGKGRRSLFLELRGQAVDVDARLGEAGENALAVPSVRGHDFADLAVVCKCLEGTLRHRVDREGRGELFDIERVGSLRIFRASAGPEEALGAGAGICSTLKTRRSEQFAIGLVGAPRDGDAEPAG